MTVQMVIEVQDRQGARATITRARRWLEDPRVLLHRAHETPVETFEVLMVWTPLFCARRRPRTWRRKIRSMQNGQAKPNCWRAGSYRVGRTGACPLSAFLSTPEPPRDAIDRLTDSGDAVLVSLQFDQRSSVRGFIDGALQFFDGSQLIFREFLDTTRDEPPLDVRLSLSGRSPATCLSR